MPSVSQIASGASLPVSLGMALMKVPTPYTIAAGVGLSLIGLVDKIGQGRKSANKFTQNGGPQDIINKQLAVISSAHGTPEEKAQATEKAWGDFLSAANQFAAENPKQSAVVQRAIYRTPGLTDTVQSLMGKNPLDPAFTDVAAPGIAEGLGRPAPGPSVKSALINAGISAGSAYAMSKMRPASQVAQPAGTMEPGNPDWQGPIYQPKSATWPSISRVLPQVVSSGASLLSGVIGSRAAGQAATVQSDAALEGARLQSEAGNYATEAQSKAAADALAFNRETIAQQQANQQPWIDAGTGALRKVSDIVGAPGYSWNQTFKPPTPEEAMQDPGIKFQLEQGQRAIEAYMRSSGTMLSGRAIKEINDYAQGVASQGYQNVYNRRANEYGTNYNTFSQERSARLNPELAVAGLGQTSTGQINADLSRTAGQNADIGLTMAGNIGNIATGTARTVGDLQTSASAARASGYMGRAQAWGDAVGNIANNSMDTRAIAEILRLLQKRK